MKPFHRAAVVGACLVLSACGGTTDPLLSVDPLADGHFTTDAREYTARRFEGTGHFARYRFTVVSRFENRSANPRYFARCFPNTPTPIFSVMAADISTESAYAQISACVGHDQQFEVPPGATRVDTIQVEGPNTFNGITNEPYGVKEGIFRLFFDVRVARGDGAPAAPDAERVSNTFVVRTAQ